MEIFFEESFEKDLRKIKDKKIKVKLKQIIEEIKQARDMHNIRNLKKLQNYKTYYRIRIGDYRLGIEIIKEKVILTRILNRKDLYKYFP
ncbi:type II toxin-antitoxin system RelE/ParE family toxin [Candidatus Brocadia pituitae]|nr:type II toxin-antitoxin system RelE/ParE family toxin [Candidatus Brocadia pituitae]